MTEKILGQKVHSLVTKIIPPWKHFIFSRKPIFFVLQLFIQLPMAGGLKNQNFDKKNYDMVPQWVQKAPFGAYLQFLVLQLLEIAPS
jgi:hypothetical protein